jgi:hypothetical protein
MSNDISSIVLLVSLITLDGVILSNTLSGIGSPVIG